MGRYTLLLVLAAVAGGSYLSYTALRTQAETGDRRAGSQAAVLARQLAESGQAIALTAITQDDGFDASGGGVFIGTRDYRGGTIGFDTLDVEPLGDGRQRATLLVSGAYDEAKHRLRSVYDFDPMDFPGPIWLDVPYATAAIDRAATVAGDGVVFEPQIDPTKNDDLALGRDGFSLAAAKGQFAAAGSPVPEWDRPGDADGKGRTGDLNNGGSSADDLYFQLSNAAARPGPTNRVLVGSRTLSGTIGAPDAITLVKGDVTVRGAVRGQGALVVEGDLRVPGRMDWEGLVVVRSEAQHATVDLSGAVTITGALVVSQEAYPPGGHVDLTVFRSPTGSWSPAWGRREGGPSASLGPSPTWSLAQPFRWFEHTHRFDQPADGDADRLAGRVRFYDRAGDPHGRYAALGDLLRHLGSKRVRIEFAHVRGAHGHAVYDLDVEGREPVSGTVAQGFAETAMEGSSTFRSARFEARDLRRLTVRPRSRRSLRKLWDGPGRCPGDEWPYCVGEDQRNRRGALTVRVIDDARPGTVYYEGAIYWHMQAGEEQAEHLADKAEWQAGVASGETPFGTTFTMGPRARVTYAGGPIVALAEKAGFKGNEVIHVSTESDLTETNETRALDAADAPSPPAAGPAVVCHRTGGGTSATKTVGASALQAHLDHGDTRGACPAPPPSPPAGDARTNPAQPPSWRCPGGKEWEWDDGRWECD